MERADFFRKRILFIKGVFFNDWSLVFGALIVNSGVVFCLYQIGKRKKVDTVASNPQLIDFSCKSW